MNKLLHHNGFTYKKSAGISHWFSAETQRAFVDIHEALKPESSNAPILFIDGVPSTQGTLARLWLDVERAENYGRNNG